MEKRGIRFGLERLINIIIAVLCIVILVYLIARLYNFTTEQNDLQKATKNFENIKMSVESVKTSNQETRVIALSPKKWVLKSFKKGSYIPTGICPGYDFCLCICQEGNCVAKLPRVCQGYDYSVEVKGSYTSYQQSFDLDLSTEYENAIGFVNAATELRIFIENNKIIIEEVKQ